MSTNDFIGDNNIRQQDIKVLRDFIKTCQRKGCRDEGGAILSSIFTVDKDNMPRPAVAGWSLGAYQVIMPNAPTSLQIQ